MHKLRTLHLFSGAGGGILADLLLGHQTICAVEINPYCRKVLGQRQKDGILPWFPIFDDVKDFDGTPWKSIADVVAGGFPCKGISVAGSGTGLGHKESGLWSEQRRIIGEIRPPIVFIENSPALTIRGGVRVVADLASMGYDCWWGIVSAADAIWYFGTPCLDHLRERIWMLGTLADNSGFRLKMRRLMGERIRRELKAHDEADSGNSEIANNHTFGRFSFRQDKNAKEKPTKKSKRNRSENSNANQPRRADQRIQTGATGKSVRKPAGFINPADGGGVNQSWWSAEPGVGRVVNGVANIVDRLEAIGNGQCPASAALAWKILSEGII